MIKGLMTVYFLYGTLLSLLEVISCGATAKLSSLYNLLNFMYTRLALPYGLVVQIIILLI